MDVVRKLDNLLNGVTMYRLVIYVLGGLAGIGIAFSIAGVLQFSWVGLAVSLALAVAVCYGANLVLSWVWNVPTNTESWLITALILFCIMPPATTSARIAGMVVAAGVAMAGKFVIALHGRHLFNPAAFGAVAAGLVGLAYAGWWIGSAVMLPFMVLGGLAVLRKTRKFTLFFCFVAAALVMMLAVGVTNSQPVPQIIPQAFTSWPLIFFGTIMLTEPSTLPARHSMQMVYAAGVGLLFAAQLRWGVLATTPHMVLLAGNLFSYFVSSRRRMLLRLEEKRQLSPTMYDFVFKTDMPHAFKAGQYMEWTLPHDRADDRGNRRTFTVASAPEEDVIHLGVRFYQPASSFKRALHALEPGRQLWAGHVAGDFVLPDDPSRKMVWIAGGIGVTPFRSMAQHIIQSGVSRDAVLLYVVSRPEDLVYMDVFKRAEAFGVRTIPVLSGGGVAPKDWHGRQGLLTRDVVAKVVPDYAARHFYLSGPNAMVAAYRRMVGRMGLPRRQIITDYFSGY